MKLRHFGTAASSRVSGPGYTPHTLTYSSGGDTNGVFYWIGSHDLNGDSHTWANPANRVLVSALQGWDGGYGQPRYVVSRGTDTYNAWVSAAALPNAIIFSLGSFYKLKPNKITLQSEGNPGCHPKDWILYGSNDGTNWTVLQTVTNSGISSTYTWYDFAITSPDNGYSYFKLDITATSGGNAVRLNELELYGELSQLSGLTFYEEGPPNGTGTKGYFYYRGTHDTNGAPRAWVNPVGNGITQTVSSQPWGNLGIHLTDRNNGTFWDTDGATNAWSKWDLGVGKSLVVSGYYLSSNASYDGVNGYKLQGSNDDTNWTDIHQAEMNYYIENNFPISQGCNKGVTDAFRYIRLLTFGSRSGSFREIELYGYEPA